MREPLLRRAVPLLSLALAASTAQTVGAEATEIVADVQTAVLSDSTNTATVERATGPRPRTALIRSALLPGWGQLNNGRHFKATLFGGCAIGFLTAVLAERDNLSHTDKQIRKAHSSLAVLVATGGDDPQLRSRISQLEGEFEDRAARRNTRLLYLFTTATLAAVDAYVDAHLDDFGPAPTSLNLLPLDDGVSVQLIWSLPSALVGRLLQPLDAPR